MVHSDHILMYLFPCPDELPTGRLGMAVGRAGGPVHLQGGHPALPSLEPDLEDSFLVKLCGSPGKKTGAAVRWAVVIGDDDSLVVTLQGNLPFSSPGYPLFIP
jgi:hypothetical protein